MNISTTVSGLTTANTVPPIPPASPADIDRTSAALTKSPPSSMLERMTKVSETAVPPPRSLELLPHEIRAIAGVVQQASTGEVSPVSFREVAEQAAAHLFGKLDTDADRLIRIGDLPLPQSQFDRIDRDGDGGISRGELADAIFAEFTTVNGLDPTLGPEQIAERFLAQYVGTPGAPPSIPPLHDATTPAPPSSIASALASSIASAPVSSIGSALRSSALPHHDPTTPAPVSSIASARPSSVLASSALPHDDPTTPAPATFVGPGPLADLSEVTQNIITQLEKAGFTDQPPINLHDLFSALGLDFASARSILQMMTARYPHGLGISLLG